jgi:hypothetical protein
MAGKSDESEGRRLLGLLRAQATVRGLNRPGWILEATSAESEPLFATIRDMSFLSSLPKPVRISLVVGYALQLLREARVAVESPQNLGSARILCCLEVDGWDLYESGEAAVPFVALLTVPAWNRLKGPLWRLPTGRRAALLMSALDGDTDQPVARIASDVSSKDKLYVGIDDSGCARFRSIG